MKMDNCTSESPWPLSESYLDIKDCVIVCWASSVIVIIAATGEKLLLEGEGAVEAMPNGKTDPIGFSLIANAAIGILVTKSNNGNFIAILFESPFSLPNSPTTVQFKSLFIIYYSYIDRQT